jgi:chromosome segregation protein
MSRHGGHSESERIPLLKSIELQGYKTFASKTEFVFGPSITAIVGPNGTGKSNIADAIRWVLGEQSFGLLRGKRTEDMIFSGSETRARAGMAGVTITFSNIDEWLPIDYSEVSIGRRAYRDGQNEYLLNGQKVRLRDIQELLAESGLAQRTYTVIGQGMVDAALALRANERRELFEEAAGIGLYRIRREEAERRLEKTRRNLERVEDILAELKPTLRRLRRQAERAASHSQVREELRSALRQWYGYHWHRLRDEVERIGEQTREQAALSEGLRRSQQGENSRLAAIRRRIGEQRMELHALSQQLTTLSTERESHIRRLAVTQERLRGLEEQGSLLRQERESALARKGELETILASAREEHQKREAAVRLAEEAAAALGGGEDLGSGLGPGLKKQVQTLRQAVEASVAGVASLRAKLDRNRAEQGALAERISAIRVGLGEGKAHLAKAGDEYKGAVAELAQAEERRAQAEASLEGLQDRLAGLESGRDRSRERRSALREQREKVAAGLKALRDRPEAPERTTERLMQAARGGELNGLVGELRQGVRSPGKYRIAIEAALGEFSSGLAFRSREDVARALDWLQARARGNKAALAPIKPARQPFLLGAPQDAGCLGNAADMVECDPEYEDLAHLLLNRTLIVENRTAAHRLLPRLPLDGRVVTLAGEVFHSTGLVLVGVNGTNHRAKPSLGQLEKRLESVELELRSAEREVDRLEEAVAQTKAEVEAARGRISDAMKSESGARLRLERAGRTQAEAERDQSVRQEELEISQRNLGDLRREYEAFLTQIGETEAEKERLGEQLARLERELEQSKSDPGREELERRLESRRAVMQVAERRVTELEDQLRRVEGDLADWEGRLRANEAERSQLEPEIVATESRVSELDGQVSALRDKIQPLEKALSAAEGEREELEKAEGRKREELERTETDHSRLQIELARREEELNSMKRRIEDDFGLILFADQEEDEGHQQLILEGLFERLPRVDTLPEEFGQQVNNLRAQLRRMGSVSPQSQSEYEDLKRRVEFLTAQLADLREAEGQLGEVIGELDELMEREFRRTFEEVAGNFKSYFRRLFDGGSARLVLDGGAAINEMGIEIEARLPGRREQTLAMLSGGERSLTAISLIFALLKVSKTPFCVLDEVDAMLDEINIVRFREMLGELSEDTQFILITHARQTVQAAEVVYGITMGSDSTSRVISMRLDEVERELALK